MKKIGLIGLVLACSVILPSISLAQGTGEAWPGIPFANTSDGDTKEVIGEGTVLKPTTEGTLGENAGTRGTVGENTSAGSGKTSLTNPLKAKSLTDFLQAVLDVILVFAVPIIVLFIIYGGFQLVTARGNQTQLQSARATITWAIVGGVIVLAANLILDVITSTVNAI